MILRERTSVVVLYNDQILVFRAIDPTSGQEYYFIPGGKIEGDEQPWQAAERECLEETGYDIKVEQNTLIYKEYDFNWDGSDYRCHTYFYRAELVSDFKNPQKVNDAAYNKGALWISVDKIALVFGYHPVILEVVSKLAAQARN